MTTDEALAKVVAAIESAILSMHESLPFQVEVTYAGAEPGREGTVEFREFATEREWTIGVWLRSDPT